jgi:hypothetical protein
VQYNFRFARFLKWAAAHGGTTIETRGQFAKIWDKQTARCATEDLRFAAVQAIANAAPAAKATRKTRERAADHGDAFRKPRNAPPSAEPHWPLATEAAAIIAAKATPEPEPDAASAKGGSTADALAALAAPIAPPAPDPIATRRAAKTLAQRLRRAAAKAAVQWRGEPERTAAAAE